MERGVVSATCIAQHIETFRKQAAGDANRSVQGLPAVREI